MRLISGLIAAIAAVGCIVILLVGLIFGGIVWVSTWIDVVAFWVTLVGLGGISLSIIVALLVVRGDGFFAVVLSAAAAGLIYFQWSAAFSEVGFNLSGFLWRLVGVVVVGGLLLAQGEVISDARDKSRSKANAEQDAKTQRHLAAAAKRHEDYLRRTSGSTPDSPSV